MRGSALAAVAAVLVGSASGFVSSPALSLRSTGNGALISSRLQCNRGRAARAVGMLRMQSEKPTNSMAKGIGKGLADFAKEMDAQTEERSGKEALFGAREAAIKQAAEKDLQDMSGGELSTIGEIPIPEPIILNQQDFEKTVWKVQVEKSGNWFSGNYCPDEFMVALGDYENGVCEFGGDPFTKGKWYLDNECLYIERRPLGALGPFAPGKEYYRVSLTAWATDDLKIQGAGYVSGFSPLFPVAILGRCLITRQKLIDESDLKQKIRAAAGKVKGTSTAARELPAGKGTSTKKRVKIVDLSEDLTEEELRRKEAAEWVPSTVVDTKKSIADKVQTGMGSSLERLKGTLEESMDNYNKIKD